MQIGFISRIQGSRVIQNGIERYLKIVPSRHPPIIVSSFGRAGSTLVWDALRFAMARDRLGKLASAHPNSCSGYAFNLSKGSQLKAGVVYKSHDYPEIMKSHPSAKAVFLFGSATDAALSVFEQKELRGEDWVRLHFKHLHRPYCYDQLLDRDVLGFQEQCLQWMGYNEAPVLCLRFESLWDNIEYLSNFCELKVSLQLEESERKKKLI